MRSRVPMRTAHRSTRHRGLIWHYRVVYSRKSPLSPAARRCLPAGVVARSQPSSQPSPVDGLRALSCLCTEAAQAHRSGQPVNQDCVSGLLYLLCGVGGWSGLLLDTLSYYGRRFTICVEPCDITRSTVESPSDGTGEVVVEPGWWLVDHLKMCYLGFMHHVHPQLLCMWNGDRPEKAAFLAAPSDCEREYGGGVGG